MRRILSITVTSFTLIILLVCSVGIVLDEPLPFFILTFPPKVALMCLLVALLMKGYESLFILLKLPFRALVDVGVRAFIVVVITFWFGPLIDAFEIRNPAVLGITIGIVVLTFAVTYAFSYRAFMDDVEDINQRIQAKRNSRLESK